MNLQYSICYNLEKCRMAFDHKKLKIESQVLKKINSY